jgi:hypothetical protein
MYKELGFTKYAKISPSVIWGTFKEGLGKIIDEGPAFTKKLREAAEGIAGPLGIKLPPQTHTKPADTVKKVIKGRGFGTGLALGVGGGIVGTATMNALFGRNRNSPYYPY